jgi:hypothetical protein
VLALQAGHGAHVGASDASSHASVNVRCRTREMRSAFQTGSSFNNLDLLSLQLSAYGIELKFFN